MGRTPRLEKGRGLEILGIDGLRPWPGLARRTLVLVKLIIIAAILSLVIGAGWRASAAIYDAGYEKAELVQAEALDALKDEIARKAVEDWRAAQDVAGGEIDTEIRIVEKIRIVEREIPKIIEKIVEVKPDCADLPELGRLFTEQAEAANSRQADPAEDPG